MRHTPSFWRIIQVDYLASLGVIASVVMWGMALLFRLFDPEMAQFFGEIAPWLTGIGLALLLWRIQTIRSVFAEGDETSGVVSSAFFFRGRGRVEVVYTHQGRKWISGNAVQSTKRTRLLSPGQEVTVMVDRFHPKRAFLSDLYL